MHGGLPLKGLWNAIFIGFILEQGFSAQPHEKLGPPTPGISVILADTNEEDA